MYNLQPNITKFKYVASTFETIASKFCLSRKNSIVSSLTKTHTQYPANTTGAANCNQFPYC